MGNIDFKAIVAQNSLEAIITATQGAPDVRQGRKRWLCPFHADSSPSLYLFNGGKHWRCWPCGPDARGDVIDFIARRDNICKVDAAKKLDLTAGEDDKAKKGTKPAKTESPKPRSPRAVPWHDRNWQVEVDRIIARAADLLWSPAGRDALDWLRRERGLEDRIIRQFRLGFVAETYRTQPLEVLGLDDEGKPKGILASRGIVMPWCAPRSWHNEHGARWLGATVRRLRNNVWDPWTLPGKCIVLTGTRREHPYPFPLIEDTQDFMPVLIVEGELDALVGHQEAGAHAFVATFGGGSQQPHPDAVAELDKSPLWLVATDVDPAGSKAAWDWHDRSPEKARRALLAHGKDLSQFHLDGGDVAGWVKGLITEHQALIPAESPGWQERVAGWPIDRWVAWRRRSAEIQATYEGAIDAADVRLADREAYDELVMEASMR